MTGIDAPFATLFGFPFRNQSEVVQGSIVAFGAPVQSVAPRRTGAEFGPSAIRETSGDILQSYLASPSRTVVDLSNGRTTQLRDIAGSLDLGDLECDGQVSTHDVVQIAQVAAAIVDAGGLPVLLGGDQRVFEGLVRGVNESAGARAIISFSDRITLPTAIDAGPLPIAALATASGDSSSVLCIGVNGLQSAADWVALDSIGGRIITADALHETPQQALETINLFIEQQGSCVCCIDLEVVDSGHAAGTPSVNVGGLTPEQLIDLLSETDISTSLAGVAVTNIAPKLDRRGLTELAAAEALLALLDSQLFLEVTP